MKMKITAAFLAAACLGSPAIAQTTSETSPMMTPAVADTHGMDSVSCRITYHQASVIPASRTCMTERQWRFIRLQTQQDIRQLQMRGDIQVP
jgi:hypothetical protein